MQDEKIIDKVRKLLLLSQSSNPNESASDAAKAQALIQQYNLELSQIQVAENRGPEYCSVNFSLQHAFLKRNAFVAQARGRVA